MCSSGKTKAKPKNNNKSSHKQQQKTQRNNKQTNTKPPENYYNQIWSVCWHQLIPLPPHIVEALCFTYLNRWADNLYVQSILWIFMVFWISGANLISLKQTWAPLLNEHFLFGLTRLHCVTAWCKVQKCPIYQNIKGERLLWFLFSLQNVHLQVCSWTPFIKHLITLAKWRETAT